MRFTIAIPAYKAKYLKECIESILDQSYTDFELVIVNDASPENLEAIVRTFSDARIRYYKNELNTGAENVVNNWNICLSYAKGDYFLLMGDDDKLASNYLEEINRLIELYPTQKVFHCRSLIIDEKGDVISITESRSERESVYEMIWERMQGHRIQFVSDFVYHTATLKKQGGYFFNKLALASDDITAYLMSETDGIINTNLPLLMYRQSNITITSTGKTLPKLDAIIEEGSWINKFIEKSNSSLSNTDQIVKQLIKDYLENYIFKKKVFVIADDILEASNPLFRTYSLSKQKQLITKRELKTSILYSLKIKLQKRNG